MNLPNPDDFKPIPADDTVKKFEAEKLKPVEEIKFKPKQTRENVPPLELAFLKFKAWLRNDVSGYVDKKIEKGMEIGIKAILAKFWWVGLIVIGLVLLKIFL